MVNNMYKQQRMVFAKQQHRANFANEFDMDENLAATPSNTHRYHHHYHHNNHLNQINKCNAARSLIRIVEANRSQAAPPSSSSLRSSRYSWVESTTSNNNNNNNSSNDQDQRIPKMSIGSRKLIGYQLLPHRKLYKLNRFNNDDPGAAMFYECTIGEEEYDEDGVVAATAQGEYEVDEVVTSNDQDHQDHVAVEQIFEAAVANQQSSHDQGNYEFDEAEEDEKNGVVGKIGSSDSSTTNNSTENTVNSI
jgi:hypothetical protein